MSPKAETNPPPENHDLQRQEKTISGTIDRLQSLQGGLTGDSSTINQLRAPHPYVLLAVCGLLLLAVALVFGQTLWNDFVHYDDNDYVCENTQVVQGLTVQGIAWALTTKHACNWYPLTWLSHMLDCQLYGLKPWGAHLTHLLLHAATAILLFLLLRRITGDL